MRRTRATGRAPACAAGTGAWVDLVFVAGTIVALKLGTIHLYAREFARVLTPGGMVVFDYIDPTTAEGWAHLQTEGIRLADVYTYHAPEIIDRVFANAGSAAVGKCPR